MSVRSQSPLKLNALIGALILLASGVYFASKFPWYAYLIFAIIFLIYFISQKNILKHYAKLLLEFDALTRARSGDQLSSDTEVGQRQQVINKLSGEGKSVPASAFREILSARQAAKQVGNGAYAVVLLGLLGTFIGLADVVSDAGVISSNVSQNIEDLIPNIFSNMRGIFGTTLCGLAASFLLRRNEDILEGTSLEFYADLEEYTQFELMPQLEAGGENPVAEGMVRLANSFQEFQAQFKSELIQPFKSLVEESHQGLAKLLQEQQGAFGERLQSEIKSSQTILLEQNQSLLEATQKQFAQDAASIQKGREELYQQLASSFEGLSQKMVDQAAQGGESLVKSQEQQAQLIEQLGQQLESKLDQVSRYEESRQEQMTQQMSAIDAKHQEFLEGFRLRGESWINSLQDFSTELSEGMKKLNQEGLEKLSENFQHLSEAARAGLESTTTMSTEVQSRLQEMMTSLMTITESAASSSEYMKVNQVEMQSTIEMFNRGVEMLLEAQANQGDEAGEEQNFYQKLETSLEVFHEKASESLIENSVRTQEILLELLQKSNEPGS